MTSNKEAICVYKKNDYDPDGDRIKVSFVFTEKEFYEADLGLDYNFEMFSSLYEFNDSDLYFQEYSDYYKFVDIVEGRYLNNS